MHTLINAAMVKDIRESGKAYRSLPEREAILLSPGRKAPAEREECRGDHAAPAGREGHGSVDLSGGIYTAVPGDPAETRGNSSSFTFFCRFSMGT